MVSKLSWIVADIVVGVCFLLLLPFVLVYCLLCIPCILLERKSKQEESMKQLYEDGFERALWHERME